MHRINLNQRGPIVKGFLPQSIRKGANGLGNMDKRLTEIGGMCRVNSMRGAGCRVVFSLPLIAPRLTNAWFFSLPFKPFSHPSGPPPHRD